MANSELFILGDPRFLSGGATSVNNTSYDHAPPRVRNSGTTITSQTVLAANPKAAVDEEELMAAIASLGQQVHHGRDSYHAHQWHSDSCSTRMNIFTPEGPAAYPTLGVEIETYLRDGITREHMCKKLRSNWFHFEEDGSLSRTLGHELITEVLHPRVYRDLRLWTGLQNIAAPYLDSWSHEDTGLHVHVGVEQFKTCPWIPAIYSQDRVDIAKLAIALIYYGFIDPSLSAKIMLRKDTRFCKSSIPQGMSQILTGFSGKKLTSTDLFNAAASMSPGSAHVQSTLAAVTRFITNNSTDAIRSGRTINVDVIFSAAGRFSEFSSHGSELNMDHPFTIEFRRGKGTLNAISVHRMVEFTSLIVRYVWKLARMPDEEVSSRSVYEYILTNTSSGALKAIVTEYLNNLK